MAISFKCGGCAKQYTVKDELAGKRAQCKKCNTVMKVPLASEPAEPDLRAESVSGAASAGGRANDETVAGSLHAMSAESLAGRGSSAAGRTSPGGRPPPAAYDSPDAGDAGFDGGAGGGFDGGAGGRAGGGAVESGSGRRSLSPLPHVPVAEQGALDVAGPREPAVHVARGPASKNRAPMEPWSFLLAVLMLGALGYAAFAGYGAYAAAKGATPEVLAEAGKPHTAVLGRYGVIAVMAFAVVAPLMLAAWVAALKIINVRLPDGLYVRSLGLAAVPVALLGLASTPLLAPALGGFSAFFGVVGAVVAYLLLHFVQAQKPAVAGVAAGIAVLLGSGGLMATQAAADAVAAPAEQAYLAKLDAVAKRQKEQLAIANTNKPSDAPAVVVPGPEEVAATGVAAGLRKQVDAFKAGFSGPKQTREKTAAAADALAQAVKDAKTRYPSRPEWDALANDLAATRTQVAALPTALPPADLNDAPPAGPDWSAKPGRHEVSAFAFNVTPPVDAKLDLDTTSALRWQITDSPAALVIEQTTSPVATQQRPWVAPAYVVDAADEKPFAVAADTTAAVEYGTINGLAAVRVAVPDASNPAVQSVTYVVHQGPTWLRCTVGPVATAADPALAMALQSIRTIHARAAGEPAIDPMPAAELVERYQGMARPMKGDTAAGGADKVVALLKGKPNAEEAVDKALGSAPDDATLDRLSPLLLATATDKSSKLLWRLSAYATPTGDAARDLLRSLEPKNADDLAFAVLDVKSSNGPQVKRGLGTISNADFDKEKLPVVSKALSVALDTPGFLSANSTPVLEAVLQKWISPDIAAGFKTLLDTQTTPPDQARFAMRVLAGTGNKKYANSICKWTMVDGSSAAATEALIAMGPAAETDVDQLLSYRGNNLRQVRQAAVAVLDEVGTARSMGPLQQLVGLSGDADTREAAKAAIAKIHDRMKAAPPAAAQPAAVPAK